MMSPENLQNPAWNYNFTVVSQQLHVRPEVLKRIVISFSQTLAEKISQLQTALSANDIAQARALLHEIRGTSGNLRLDDIFSSAKFLHEAVKAGEAQDKLMAYFEALKIVSTKLFEYVKTEENKNVENTGG